MSSVTNLWIESKVILGWHVLREENKPLQNSNSTLAIFLGTEHHCPMESLIPSIFFFRCLWVALLWTYLEFLSP